MAALKELMPGQKKNPRFMEDKDKNFMNGLKISFI
jgi:hypothetical protein